MLTAAHPKKIAIRPDQSPRRSREGAEGAPFNSSLLALWDTSAAACICPYASLDGGDGCLERNSRSICAVTLGIAPPDTVVLSTGSSYAQPPRASTRGFGSLLVLIPPKTTKGAVTGASVKSDP
ncbi:MAG TPA: hypothetical protein PKW90_22805 [Myxococcota bacterium]|nr:hypothetical protein [Myxococcota bacterium]